MYFLVFSPLSFSLSFLIISPLLLLFLLLPRFSCLEEKKIGKIGEEQYYCYYFYFSIVPCSFLGLAQAKEKKIGQLGQENLASLLLLFLLFLAQAKEKKIGQVGEEQENPASSLLILLFLLSSLFLTQAKEKKKWTDRENRRRNNTRCSDIGKCKVSPFGIIMLIVDGFLTPRGSSF